jgi:hypothetical protein
MNRISELKHEAFAVKVVSDDVFDNILSRLVQKKDNEKECLQCGVFLPTRLWNVRFGNGEEPSECSFCGGNPTITKSKAKREKKKLSAQKKKEEAVPKVVRIRRAYLQPGTEEFENRQVKPIDYFHQVEALGFY